MSGMRRKGRIERTWMSRFCHLTGGRHFLVRNCKDLSKEGGIWQVP